MQKQFLSLIAASLILAHYCPIIAGPTLSKVAKDRPEVAIPVALLASYGAYNVYATIQKERNTARRRTAEAREKEQGQETTPNQNKEEAQVAQTCDLVRNFDPAIHRYPVRFLNGDFGNIVIKHITEDGQQLLSIQSEIIDSAEKIQRIEWQRVAYDPSNSNSDLSAVKTSVYRFQIPLSINHLKEYFKIRHSLSENQAHDFTYRLCKLNDWYFQNLALYKNPLPDANAQGLEDCEYKRYNDPQYDKYHAALEQAFKNFNLNLERTKKMSSRIWAIIEELPLPKKYLEESPDVILAPMLQNSDHK